MKLILQVAAAFFFLSFYFGKSFAAAVEIAGVLGNRISLDALMFV